jgi:hypothetical protein
VETETGVFLSLARTKRRMKREPPKANGRAAHEPAAAVTTKREREATAPPPPELLVLESCLLDGIECSQLLRSIPVAVMLEWEALSMILKEGLSAVQWWERYFAQSHPVTYARIAVDTSRARAVLQSCHGSNVQSDGDEIKVNMWRATVRITTSHCVEGALQWRHSCWGSLCAIDSPLR